MQKVLVVLILIVLLIHVSGWASILFPERIGQPPSERGKLDILMCIMDAAFTLWIDLIIDLETGALWKPLYETEHLRGRPLRLYSDDLPRGEIAVQARVQ